MENGKMVDDIPKKSKKPNWFVCFFLVLADCYLSGFIGKSLVTGEKCPNRLVSFIANVFFLITDSLPIALFVSYFLITLPTWVFVLVVALMAIKLLNFVFPTNAAQGYLANRQKQTEQLEESKVLEEKANNHAKFYLYGNKYYKEKPTTLIGDFFRYIGTGYFAFLFGKNFMYGKKIERSQSAKSNVINIIYLLRFWAAVIPCFFITVPTWLFILAIMAAASRLLSLFCCSYWMRQKTMKDIFFCKCQGSDKWHALRSQVKKQNQLEVPAKLKFIKSEDVKDCADL